MAHIHATASAVLDAAPAAAYGILADYRRGHPGILPERYFTFLDVERGGTGAGTRIFFGMRSFGKVRTMRAEVTEPEPGRVLVESGLDNNIVTTFTVDPVDGGRRANVTISTTWTTPGVQGMVERLLAPSLLRRIYREELANLGRAATGRA